MALNFKSGQSALVNDASGLTAVPLSGFCWFRATNAAQVLLQLLADWSNSRWLGLLTAPGGNVRLFIHNYASGVTSVDTHSASGSPSGQWHTAGFTVRNADYRAVFLNGEKTVNTAAAGGTPYGVHNRVSIGRLTDISPGDTTDVDIAEAAFWNAELPDAAFQAMTAGLSPNRIRPDALQGYWPLMSSGSSVDLSGKRKNLTITGATAASHAPVAPAFGSVVPGHAMATAATAIEAALPIALGQNLQAASRSVLQASMSAGLSLAAVSAALAGFEAGASISLSQTLGASGLRDLVAAATLSLSAELTGRALGELAATLTLDQGLSVQMGTGDIIAAALSLALRQGQAASALLEIDAALPLEATVRSLAEADADFEAEAGVAMTLGLALLGQALLDAELSLDAVHDIAVLPDGILAELTPRGRRRLTVTIRDRTRRTGRRDGRTKTVN